jgi:hypothetical protein
MSPALTPGHLLGFHKALTHDLIHCGFHKRGRDRFIIPISVTIVRDELLIGSDVLTKFVHGFQELLAFRTDGLIFKEELQQVDDA